MLLISIINKQMRKTKQKELIEEEVKKLDSFFTAEELFKRVNQKDKKIGIATVYRFLRNLKKKEKLQKTLV